MRSSEYTMIERFREGAQRIVRELNLLDGEYKDFGLSLSECHFLIEISKRPHSTIGNLATRLNLDKSTTSRLAQKLEQKGAIELVVDSTDKRCRRLRMTKEGKDLLQRINNQAQEQVSDALDILTKEERLQAIEGIEIYARALRDAWLKKEVYIAALMPEEAPLVTCSLLDVLSECGCNRPGFASHDDELHDLHEAFQKKGSIYFVVHLGSKIVGGAGIAPLKGGDKRVCELKNMHLQPEARGLGIASTLLKYCLNEARRIGYQSCYLETTKSMKEAIALYRKFGFRELRKRKGNTGHFACEKFYEVQL